MMVLNLQCLTRTEIWVAPPVVVPPGDEPTADALTPTADDLGETAD